MDLFFSKKKQEKIKLIDFSSLFPPVSSRQRWKIFYKRGLPWQQVPTSLARQYIILSRLSPACAPEKKQGAFFSPLFYIYYFSNFLMVAYHYTRPSIGKLSNAIEDYIRHTHKKRNSDDIFQMSFISLDFGSRFYGGVMGGSQTYQLVVCLFTSLVFPPCPEKFTEAVENGLKRWKGNLYIFDRDGKRLLLAFVMLGVGVYSSFPLSFFLL